MLSIDLSKNSIQNKIERTLKVNLWLLTRMAQDLTFNFFSTTAVTQVETTIVKPELKIARTVYPDQRLDFNSTFQQIRTGIDEFNKAKYKNFQDPFMCVSAKETTDNVSVNTDAKTTGTPKEFKPTVYRNSVTAQHKIASTAFPDERVDFNKAFMHMREELEKIANA